MTKPTSRRNFLGISAMGLAAAVVPDVVRPLAAATTHGNQAPRKLSDISVWVTAGEDRYNAAAPIAWHPAAGTGRHTQIRLDPGKKFQNILGFGGAFTDATCYTFNRLEPAEREKLFHELFHPSEMGLSTGRVCVGASDYSTKAYSYDDGEADPDLKRFSIEHDREYILPVLRQARQENPDLFLF